MTTINCSGIDYLALMARITAETEADPEGLPPLEERLAGIETPMLEADELRRRSAMVTSLKETLDSFGAPDGATVH